MSWKIKLLCCGAGVCLAAALGWWWLQVPGVDVVYGKGDDTPLSLDLDYPERVGPAYPTILFLHPQAKWGQAAKQEERFRTVLRTFNEAGYLVATSHYRPPQEEAPFPGPVEDCKAAVRWLRANARSYRIDSDRVGVIGVETGGYLACMLGTTQVSQRFEGAGGSPGLSSRVQAVVSIDAPLDFTKKSWPDKFEQQVLVPFLGASFQDQPERYQQASPGTYASSDGPPFLLFHARGNQLVPITQARSLAQQLKQAGASVRLVEVDKAAIWNSNLLEETLERARAFFDDQLANQKP